MVDKYTQMVRTVPQEVDSTDPSYRVLWALAREVDEAYTSLAGRSLSVSRNLTEYSGEGP